MLVFHSTTDFCDMHLVNAPQLYVIKNIKGKKERRSFDIISYEIKETDFQTLNNLLINDKAIIHVPRQFIKKIRTRLYRNISCLFKSS